MQGNSTNWWGLGETNGNPAELVGLGRNKWQPQLNWQLQIILHATQS